MKLTGPAPRIRLPRYLLRLSLATLLPLLVFALAAGVLLARHERQTFERSAQERVRALSSAVDAALRGTITTIEALAQSDSLRTGDLASFHALAVRVHAGRADWSAVHLADLQSARQLVNTLRPFGTPLPVVVERGSVDTVRATQRPVVGDMAHGPVSQRMVFSVRVPVHVDGELRYVLSAVVNPAMIQQLLVEQRFPADWVGAVVDRRHAFVARSYNIEATLGKPVSVSLRDALSQGREGFSEGQTIDGAEIYRSFFTSSFSGWSVSIAIPEAVVEAGARQAGWQLLVGALLALLIGFGVAVWLGRRIAQPIGQLAARARALALDTADSSPAAPLHAPVLEIAHLANALEQAATAVQGREAAKVELAAVVANASLALFRLDLKGHCSYLNPAAQAMTGYSLAETAGAPLYGLLHPSPADGSPSPFGPCAIRGSLALDQRTTIEDEFVHKSGRRFPVALTASPLLHKGQPAGLIVEVRDISDDKREQAERADLLAREQQLRVDAEASNRGKDEFLAMLGHELRNPLAAIANAAHVARLVPGSDQAVRAQDIIARQVKHLTRMVDDLLDAGRVVSGKIAVVRTPIDLADVVRRCAAAFQADGRSAQHRIGLELAPLWVDGDETRLEQVVANLLGNALRYTAPGGCITVRLAAEDTLARLDVSDTGSGIAADLLPRLFNLFVQGNRGLERSQGGLGIGLMLVRRLVELHGGSVEAASPGEGCGSTFTVHLPLCAAPSAAQSHVPASPSQAPAAAHGDASIADAPAGPPTARRRRVLLVEDHDDLRDTLRAALQLAGHEVHTCADGSAAIDAARNWQAEVALIDIGLPGLSGYEVARGIRDSLKTGSTGSMPTGSTGHRMLLVALTGYGQPEDQERSLAAGFDLHITKPVHIPQLLRLIEQGSETALATR